MTRILWTALAGLMAATPGQGQAPGQAPASDTLPISVAERQIEAFNRRDLDAFMALYAEDAVVLEFPSGAVLTRGKPAIRDRYASTFRSLPADFPAVRVEPRVVEGPFVLDHEVWKAAPGQRDHAVWMYEIRGGLIRRAWTLRM